MHIVSFIKKIIIVFMLFYILASSFLFTLFFSLGIAKYSNYYNKFDDIIFNCIFLFEDQTTYAPLFSEEKFKTLTPGMSKEDVVTLLGEPLKKNIYTDKGNYREYWRYTSGPPDSSFWFRNIAFNREGYIIDIDREYYVD